ncbi:ArgE/DapE family deacylase [Sinirhodobacter populi]|uniref:ArgE/DapE family deacylase n=1 Tax=Paenirhodobacter populi TaxID=2306993 RepID=A0A443K2T1_9RHOB|nr:ArgE/DapE family deacylase [Sinirhodobacter populi]RWR27066.1 ArgE/DapE family deacylase [Sinirhodobacter populi]
MTTLEDRISKATEAASDRIAQTLMDLIDFPSEVKANPKDAGPGEHDCQVYLQGRLEALGFDTDLWDPDGPALYEKYKGRPAANKGRTFEGRPNLGGRLKGNGNGPSVFLTGHIDVVPPGPAEHWNSDPYKAVLREGKVFGRGAVDMKGGVACMLMAVEILKQDLGLDLSGDVVWGTVVDEEIGGMGALAMADRGWRADVGIMTEPSANAISPICHGILWGKVIIDGIGGHAELRPNNWNTTGPVDAIMLCRQILDGIDILNRRWQFDPRKNHPLMDLPCMVLPTMINAGEHPASMAGRAEITVDIQYLPSEKDDHLLGGHVKREFEEHIAAVCQADPYLRAHPARVEWILDADCAEVPADHPFVRLMQDAISEYDLPTRLVGNGSHTDMGIPTELGNTPTLNFGPGDPALCHQPNEHVSVSDLVACTRAIALTVARWCNQEKTEG